MLYTLCSMLYALYFMLYTLYSILYALYFTLLHFKLYGARIDDQEQNELQSAKYEVYSTKYKVQVQN